MYTIHSSMYIIHPSIEPYIHPSIYPSINSSPRLWMSSFDTTKVGLSSTALHWSSSAANTSVTVRMQVGIYVSKHDQSNPTQSNTCRVEQGMCWVLRGRHLSLNSDSLTHSSINSLSTHSLTGVDSEPRDFHPVSVVLQCSSCRSDRQKALFEVPTRG